MHVNIAQVGSGQLWARNATFRRLCLVNGLKERVRVRRARRVYQTDAAVWPSMLRSAGVERRVVGALSVGPINRGRDPSLAELLN